MRKMYVIFMILLVNRIISAEDSSETKYIDLLPEKEKEEFLEKIARRIFNGVQSKDDRDRLSGEVSDTELNQHDAFVNQILFEESKNLRKNGAKAGNNDDFQQEGEELTDKQDVHETANEAELVDLTLRDNKRDKRNGFAKTDKQSKIVHIVSNAEVDELDNTDILKEDKDGSDKEDIQIKVFKTTKNALETTRQSSSNSPTRQTTDFHENNKKSDSKEANQTTDFGAKEENSDTISSRQTTALNANNEKSDLKEPEQTTDFNSNNEKSDSIEPRQTTALNANNEKSDLKEPRQTTDFIINNDKRNSKNAKRRTDFVAKKEKNDSKEAIATGQDQVNQSVKDDIKLRETKEGTAEDSENTKSKTENVGTEDDTRKQDEFIEKGSSEKNSDDLSTKTKAIESVTMSEHTSPGVKSTEMQTENILVESDTTEVKNTNPNARILRDTVSTLKDTEEKSVEITTIEGSIDKEHEGHSNLNKTNSSDEIKTLNILRLTTEPNNENERIRYLEMITDVTTTQKITKHVTEHATDTTEKNIEASGKIVPIKANILRTRIESDDSNNDKELKESKKTHPDTTNSRNFISKVNKNTLQKIEKDIPKENSKTKHTKNKDSETKSMHTKDNKQEKVKQQKKKEKKDKNIIYNYVNDMIKVLRTKVKSEPIHYNNKLKTIHLYDGLKSKKYNIYEIPPNKKPFIKKDKVPMSKDSPFYVPIYNYSPNNAYYNPYNRLGPNTDDNEDEIIERSQENEENNYNLDVNEKDDVDTVEENDRNEYTNLEEKNEAVSDELKYTNEYKKDTKFQKLVSGYKRYKNQRKFKFGTNTHQSINNLPYKLNLPVVVKHPKFTDIILNPNDYLDVDYYYGNGQEAPSIRSRCALDTDRNKYNDSNNKDTDSSGSDEEDNKNNLQNHMMVSNYPDSDEEQPSNNLKGHLSSARQILFQQQRFGHIPPNNASVTYAPLEVNKKNKTVLRLNKKEKDLKHDNKNIAVDYFYGRMKDDEVDKKKNLNKPNKLNLKNKETLNNVKHNKMPHKFEAKKENRTQNINEIKPATPLYTDVPNLSNITIRRTKEDETNNETDGIGLKEFLLGFSEHLLTNMDQVESVLNLTTKTRTGDDLEPYLTALGDMVRNDAKALKQYDWLGTTVDIQSALLKLMDMTDSISKNLTLSHQDLQLLKYTIYLHKSTKKIRRKQFRKPKFLPRNRKKKRGILKESGLGLLSRHWLFRMMAKKYDTIITSEDFDEFNDLLDELQYYLYDLHSAITQIANITKFNTQNWYENLKELYLDTKRENLLEVLLHITTIRLLDLVENAAKDGVEDDFLTYVLHNDKKVKRTEEEISFALRIIDELMVE